MSFFGQGSERTQPPSSSAILAHVIDAVLAPPTEREMTCPACAQTILVLDGEELCFECGWADESTLK